LIDIQLSFIDANHPDSKRTEAVLDFDAIKENIAQLVDLTHRYCVIPKKEYY
jgi:hypothetical protein